MGVLSVTLFQIPVKCSEETQVPQILNLHNYIRGFLYLLIRVQLCKFIHTYLLTNLLTYLFSYLLTYLLTHLLTPWSRILLQRLTGSQLVKKKSPHFMESEGSLPHSQVLATCHYPEAA